VRRGSAMGGRDVLIEPLEAVGVNNRLEALSGQIAAEQQRVLRTVTDEVRAQLVALQTLVTALTWVDLAVAAGRLSTQLNAHPPRLVDTPRVELNEAYHPLLLLQFADGQLDTLVPLTLRLDERQHMLLITGPNTGGKTVALKTLGLITTMAHCGLHVPAEGECTVGAYARVLVDVGDRQSLYHHLSTFAGHVQVLKRIIEEADGATLVLLDELGTGTDPEEGAALAMAVLDELMARGVQGVVNTHLSPLKEYARERPGLLNASMTFDQARLCPTYRLRLGEPGASLGLTIAEGGGLAPELIRRARGHLERVRGKGPGAAR
jgi:DNA mismatch repair protein MutS2